MEKSIYNNLIINGKLHELTNINNLNDLVDCKYLNLYLIEYLLKENIHTKIMDSRAMHSSRWVKFYLKYDVLKPLLNCYLKPLLDVVNGKLIFDTLLGKLNDEEKLELLSNLKKSSYWELHDHEKEVIELYRKHGINLPQIFIDNPSVLDSGTVIHKKDEELINEFCEVFKDTSSFILNIYLHEFKKHLMINAKRAREDIKKFIANKKRNKNFILQISSDADGEYNDELNSITISPKRQGILVHEMSHLLYDKFDNSIDESLFKKYEKICSEINQEQTISKIVSYLKVFHERFYSMKDYFEKIYYNEIRKKYGSFNNYIKAICEDINGNNSDMIAVDSDSSYFYIDDENIVDVVTELLAIEKNEFVNNCTYNYYTEELMLENLLDAVLKGAIWEEKLGIRCLSGHTGLYFVENEDASFDECLADYDTIKNSKKAKRLLDDLEYLVGVELIDFLDDYLEKNRGLNHEI